MGLGSSHFHVSVIHTLHMLCASNKVTSQIQCDNLQMSYHPLKISNKMTLSHCNNDFLPFLMVPLS